MALAGRSRPAKSFIVGPHPSAVAPQTSTDRLRVFRPVPRPVPPPSRFRTFGPKLSATAPAPRLVRLFTPVREPTGPRPRSFVAGPRYSAVAPRPAARLLVSVHPTQILPRPRSLWVRQQQTPAAAPVTANPPAVRIFSSRQPTGPRARVVIVGYGLSAAAPKTASDLVVVATQPPSPARLPRGRWWVTRSAGFVSVAATPNPRTVRAFTPPRPAPPVARSRIWGAKPSAPATLTPATRPLLVTARQPTGPRPRSFRIRQGGQPARFTRRVVRYSSSPSGRLPVARSFLCRGRQQVPAAFVRRVWWFHPRPAGVLERPRSVWQNVGPRPRFVVTNPPPRWMEDAAQAAGTVSAAAGVDPIEDAAVITGVIENAGGL